MRNPDASRLTRLRHQVDASSVLSHPYFQLLDTGSDQMVRKLVTSLIVLDAPVAHGFAPMLATIISRCGDPETRMALSENLWDEHGNGHADQIHVRLFDAMARSVGVHQHELDAAASATSRFLDLHYLLLNASLVDAVAAFCYASEYLCLKEFAPIDLHARRVFPQFDPRYFEENVRVDGVHTRRLEQALVSLAQGDSDWVSAECAVGRALDARAEIYDMALVLSGIWEGERNGQD